MSGFFGGGGGSGGFFTDGAGTNAGIGKGTVAPTAAGENSLAQGDSCAAAGANSFALGDTSTIHSTCDTSLALGNTVAVGSCLSTHGAVLAQGFSLAVTDAHFGAILLQGDGTSGGSVAAGSWAHLNQGFNVVTQGYGVLAQGINVTATAAVGLPPYGPVFAQGSELVASGRNLMVQGNGINVSAASVSTFAQGLTIGPSVPGSGSLTRCLLQGSSLTTPYYGTSDCLIQGGSHDVSGLSPSGRAFVQGNSHTVIGTNVFAQGNDHTVSGDLATAFGNTCTVAGTDAWAVGNRAHATRAQQRAWAANRGTLGGAQTSSIARYDITSNATQFTLLTLGLEEDKSYGLQISMIVRNTTTDSESAHFVLTQGLAQRNTGGSAILTNGPVSLTRLDSGGGSANLLADLAASGNNILLRVTGEVGEVYHWCVDFSFVEVAG